MPDIVLIISLTILGCAQTKNYLDAEKAAADNSAEKAVEESRKKGSDAESDTARKEGCNCADRGDRNLIWNKKHSCLYLAVSLSAGLCLLLCKWTGMGRGPEVFGQHKLTMLLLLTLSMAVVDARLKIIPNRFLLVAAAARAALYIPELLPNKAMSILADFTSCPDSDNFTCAAGAAGQNLNAFFQSVCSDLVAALLLGVVFLIVAHISRYQLGMGDVKLFALMGFYLGLRDAGLAIFCSFVVSGLTAVLLLLCKKRRVSDRMAFAPCVFLGLFAYSLLTATSLWPA
ncbi:MAG: prepilin peptidase [Clostridiaceae bacterium]|nr:prepilin peptidase [Clostridiaceae bacterium]